MTDAIFPSPATGPVAGTAQPPAATPAASCSGLTQASLAAGSVDPRRKAEGDTIAAIAGAGEAGWLALAANKAMAAREAA